MTSLALSSSGPVALGVDAVVVGIHPDPDGGAEPVLAPGAEAIAAGGKPAAVTKAKRLLATALGTVRAGTGVGTVTALPGEVVPGTPARVVLAVGLGPVPAATGGDYDQETLRRAAGAAVRALAGHVHVALALPADGAREVEALALGARLGAYAFTRYRTPRKEDRAPVEKVAVLTAQASDKAVKQAFAASEAVADGVLLARDLVNTAPADLYPADLADEAVRAGKENGLSVEVLDEKALAKGGYGGILGVGQGSVHPPRLVRIAYTHRRATRTLALVGKGITYDSGGLSLKPTDALVHMKTDMGGAAAVLGALVAIARRKPRVNVVGYLACAENMPGGAAQRPDDVLTMYGGTTVEVLNTDAEGRLVMADALVRAEEDAPDLVVDVATLTGGQVVALGTRYFGVMGSDEETVGRVVAASRRAGESGWAMPLPAELRESLESTVADIANVSGNRTAQMLVAGVFLKEFVADGRAWAHLDIAGPSAADRVDGYTVKGATGVPVRTLVQLADDLAE